MTRIFGVIGFPVNHSLSPAMHTAALRAMRLDALYAPFEVPPRTLAPMLHGLVLAGVEGLNVTVPLKEAIVPLMDQLDPTAQAVKAVNTIVQTCVLGISPLGPFGIGFKTGLLYGAVIGFLRVPRNVVT